MSKQLIIEVNSLKSEMQSLREEVRAQLKINSTSPSFDCKADLANWRNAWSDSKFRWCRKKEGKAETDVAGG